MRIEILVDGTIEEGLDLLEDTTTLEYTDATWAMGPHLDDHLLDLGIVGGEAIVHIKARSAEVEARYWSPQRLEAGPLEDLTRDVIAQWLDGVGESGLEVPHRGGQLLVLPDDENPRIRQFDDGRIILPPSPLVLAIKRGESLAHLEALLDAGESVNGTVGGYSALTRAITQDDIAICRMLLRRGIDVNYPGPLGWFRPLSSLVTSRFSDAESCELAQVMLDNGADPHADEGSERLADLADSREKPRLAELIRQRS